MKATDLFDEVASSAGVDKKIARKVITAFVEGVIEAAKKGEDVSLPGFGKFIMKDTPARQGRNPSTGEPIDIAAGRRLAFTPAKALREAITG